MSAFGKRGGIGNSRPNFGVAKPMKGGKSSSSPDLEESAGGDQFPPLEALDGVEQPETSDGGVSPGAALDRLNARPRASGDPAAGKVVGFCNPGCRDKFDTAARAFDAVIEGTTNG